MKPQCYTMTSRCLTIQHESCTMGTRYFTMDSVRYTMAPRCLTILHKYSAMGSKSKEMRHGWKDATIQKSCCHSRTFQAGIWLVAQHGFPTRAFGSDMVDSSWVIRNSHPMNWTAQPAQIRSWRIRALQGSILPSSGQVSIDAFSECFRLDARLKHHVPEPPSGRGKRKGGKSHG